VLLTNYYVYKW